MLDFFWRPPPVTEASRALPWNSASPPRASLTGSRHWKRLSAVPCSSSHSRGVQLNQDGQKYLQAIQPILTELHDVSERHRRRPKAKRLAIVSVEALAEKWLTPRLAGFKAIHPDIAIELETDHREVDLVRRDVDIWLPYALYNVRSTGMFTHATG